MSDPSQHLVEQAQAGLRPAAEELVGLHYEAIFAYFRRLCGAEADAADLTQKTFAKAWASLPAFQGRARFTTWLHGIAHHVLADWWRRPNRFECASDAWWETRPARDPSPLEDAAGRELARRLYALVGRLDAGKREAVHLHYFQGLSLAETAEALGVAESTVKYRLREALDSLRLGLAEPGPGASRSQKGAVV